MWSLLEVMKVIADSHKATVAQVALRWLLQKRPVTSVVIGAKSVAQLADNLGCLTCERWWAWGDGGGRAHVEAARGPCGWGERAARCDTLLMATRP